MSYICKSVNLIANKPSKNFETLIYELQIDSLDQGAYRSPWYKLIIIICVTLIDFFDYDDPFFHFFHLFNLGLIY